MPDKQKRLNIIRVICYLYFLVPCIIWIVDNYSVGYINWPIIILTALVVLQIIFRVNKVDLVLGILLSILSFYMVLAVTSDLVDHFNGTKRFNDMANFRRYFAFGYGIFGTAFLSALTILYTYYFKRSLAQKKEALQTASAS